MIMTTLRRIIHTYVQVSCSTRRKESTIPHLEQNSYTTKGLLRQARSHGPLCFLFLYRSGHRRARHLRHHRLLCDRRRALVRSAIREVRVQIHTCERERLVRRVEIPASATHAVHERHNHEEVAHDQRKRRLSPRMPRESDKIKIKPKREGMRV